MPHFITSLFFFTTVLVAFANETESKIYGKWKSDGDRSVAYLEQHAKLTHDKLSIAKAVCGQQVSITYNPDGSGTYRSEALSIAFNGKETINLEASSYNFKYEVVGETKSQVVVKFIFDDEFFKEYPYTLLRYEDSDSYSMSMSESIGDIHSRLFFKRSH